MSQSYHLELTAAAGTVDEVAQVVHDVVPVSSAGSPSAGLLVLSSGLRVTVSPYDHEDDEADEFLTDFGIERTSTVDLQIYSPHELDPQLDDVVTFTLSLLERLDGDAVLHYGYFAPWLMRRDGRLLLSDDKGTWTPERLALVTVPYERVPLAFSNP